MKTIKVRYHSEIPEGFTGVVRYPDGSKHWYLNGQYHREDGPAREWDDGSKEWCLNGQRHRVDGPAVEDADGSKEWWLNGQYHREDGPAREWADGSKEWYLNNKRHRVDGPAIEYADGRKEWWLNDNHVFTLEPIGEYLIIEDGLPSTMKWLDKPVSTLKVLTATGICFIPNLPGIINHE
jgi:hypothetical protein